MDCSTPGLPVHYQLPEFTQTPACWVSDAIQPSHPLSSPSPPFNCSQHQGLFKWVSLHIRWPKYWSFSFNISPSNEYSGLISFRIDRLDFLAVQGTLKSLSQQHSSKVSILCLCHKTPTSIIHKCIQILTNCSLTLIQLIVPVSLVQERSKKIKIATEGSKSGRYW